MHLYFCKPCSVVFNLGFKLSFMVNLFVSLLKSCHVDIFTDMTKEESQICMYRLLPAYEGGIVFTARDPRARAVNTIPPKAGVQ